MKRLICLLIIFMSAIVLNGATDPDWLQIKKAPVVDFRRFLPDTTGSVDCTTKLSDAIAEATTAGGYLWIPPGTYKISGIIAVTTNLLGASGSVLIGSSQASSTIIAPGSNTIVSGLTLKYARIATEVGADNIIIENNVISDVNFSAIDLMENTNVIVRNNHISNIIYSGSAADGITAMRSKYITISHNTISDFRRIGIVTDTWDALGISDEITICNNNISNAHDCDDSIGEFNAAIWAEFTDNVRIYNNVIADIHTGVGQTSGRVLGINLALGHSKECTQIVEDNTMECGVVVNDAANTYANVIIRGNIMDLPDNTSAVTCGLFKSCTIQSNTIKSNVVGPEASHSLFIVGDTTYSSELLVIEDNTWDNTYTGNATDIFFYYAHPPLTTIIRQPKLKLGGFNYAVDADTALLIENCYVTTNGASSSILLPYMFDTTTFDGCTLSDFPLWVGKNVFIKNSKILDTLSLSITSGFGNVSNSYIASGGLLLGGDGYHVDIRGCRFSGAAAEGGAIVGNVGTAAPSSSLVIQNNLFENTFAYVGTATVLRDKTIGRVLTTGNLYDNATFTNMVGTHSYNTNY